MTTANTQGTSNKIIDRLAKLFKLSQSANPHEAALAAERAAELMAEHQLDEATIRLHAEDNGAKAEPIEHDGVATSRLADKWKGILCDGVAQGFGCRVYWTYTYNQRDKKGRPFRELKVIGTHTNISAVRYTYTYLEREVERLCKVAYRELPDFERPLAAKATAWYNSFRLGAAIEVSRRMKARRKQMFKQPKVGKTDNSQALMVIRNDELAVKNEFDNMKLRKGEAFSLRRPDAYSQGRQAGRNINLDGGRGLNAPPDQLKD